MITSLLQVSPRWRFLFALLLLTGIGAWAWTQTNEIQNDLEKSLGENVAKANLLIDMRVAAVKHVKDLAGLSKSGKRQDLSEESKILKEGVGGYFDLQAKLGKVLAASPMSSKDEVLLMRKITDAATAAAPTVRKIQELAAAGNTEEVAKLAGSEMTKGPVRDWTRAIDEMTLLENELAAHATTVAGDRFEHLRTQVLIMSAGVILLGIVAAWFTFSRIGGGEGEKAAA